MKHLKRILQLILLLLFNIKSFSQHASPFLSEPAYTNLEAALKNKHAAVSLALHYRGAEVSEQWHMISQLPNLKYLSITGIYLRHIPVEIFQLKNLQALKISSSLEEIPRQLTFLKKLEYLDLTSNAITEIPDWIDEMPCLQTLILNINPIEKISDNIAHCKKLQCLYLSAIHTLKTVPEGIGKISSLEELYINNNNLHLLPEHIKDLKNLRVLDASANRLEDLPGGMVSLRKLEVLNLHGNEITKLPSQFNLLRSLKNLDLSFNPIEDDINLRLPVSLQQVKFIRSRLTAFPGALRHCTNLENVEITRSDISIIPGWISQLKKLKTLALVNNKITALPAIIKSNTSLNRINLSDNLIESIPPEIFSLPRLQYLLLANNKIASVPKEIIQCHSLEYFSVKESTIRDSTDYQQTKKSLKGRIIFEREDLVKFSTAGDCPCYSEEQLSKNYKNIPPYIFLKTEVPVRLMNYRQDFNRFFTDNVNFPDIPLSPSGNSTFSDTVLIKFVVNPAPHQLTYVSVLSAKWLETKNEALRLLRLSCPYWHPAITGSREVKAWAQVLFIFNQYYENGELKKELTVNTTQLRTSPSPTFNLR